MTDWNWCKTCWYCGLPANEYDATCDFILETGMMRGCAPGRTCTRYEPIQGHSLNRRDAGRPGKRLKGTEKQPLEERTQVLLDAGVHPQQTGLVTTRERRAAHACLRCGVKDARTLAGGQLCLSCNSDAKAKAKEAAASRVRTPDEIRKETVRKAAQRKQWAAEGLCMRCGKVPPAPGRRRCAACAEKEAAYKKSRKERMESHE